MDQLARLPVVVASIVPFAAACSGAVNVVTLDRNDSAVAGVTVFGNDANGDRVDLATTDQWGHAMVFVPAGGSITTQRSSSSWYSIFGVEPGDDILVRIGGGDERRRETVVIAPVLPAGAARMRVEAPCGAAFGNESARLSTDERCPSRGTVVITAEDLEDNTYGYIVVPDADLTQTVTATGPWVAPSLTFTVDVTGFPTAGGSLSIERGVLADGYAVHWTQIPMTTTTSTATATGFRPDAGNGVVYRLRQSNGSFCDAQSRSVTRSNVADIAQLAFDVGDMLPPLTDIDLVDREMSWVGGGGGQGIHAGFSVAPGAGDVITGDSRSWSVVLPAGTTRVRFPRDTGFVWPSAANNPPDRFASASVSETTSTYWASYAELRQRHAENPPQIDGEFTTRSVSIAREYAYLGCPMAP